ncbi:hypothetical protein D3C84_1146400 [compost metagenome]
MPVEIITRSTMGTYTARAKGYKGSASRSDGARQAAESLARKLELGDGVLQEVPSSDLGYGYQRFLHEADSASI